MFTQEDFKEQTVRLKIIINYRLGIPIFTEWKDLSPLKQKEFNKELNVYIKSLPEKWAVQLYTDFNEICADKIFHDMDCEKFYVPALGGNTLLLTEEQEKLKAEGVLKL
jgi:hypothetical protein